MRGAELLLATLLFLVAGVMPAAADGVQRIGSLTATSDCLGDNHSARCTTETFLGCLARFDNVLCARAGLRGDRPEGAERARLVEYILERESVIRPEQITDDLRHVEWYKPGFVLFEVRLRACDATAADCADEEFEDFQIYLERGDAGWRVVHWRTNGDSDAPPEVPEAFRNSSD
jgi:hypothetical protein